MALQDEKNTNLAFDTTTLKEYGNRYGTIAEELRTMAKSLDTYLAELTSDSGWKTPAGTVFSEMVQINWEENIRKYADLLDTLKEILATACTKYDGLVTNHIEKTKL